MANLTDSDIEHIMLAMPFEKFERRRFVRRQKELTQLKFEPMLWRQLSEADRIALQQIAQTALDLYYRLLTD